MVLALVLAFAPGLAHASDKVVSTQWLADHLDDPNVRIIEVSVIPGVYEQGHIPGVVDLPVARGSGRTFVRDMVLPERFETWPGRGDQQRHHGGLLRRQLQLVRRVGRVGL